MASRGTEIREPGAAGAENMGTSTDSWSREHGDISGCAEQESWGPPLEGHLQATHWDEGRQGWGEGLEPKLGLQEVVRSGKMACAHILLTVGQAAVFAHSHGLLLDVVLCEKPRLPRHHLLYGCWDDHIIDVVICLPWLPLLGWDDLWGQKGYG